MVLIKVQYDAYNRQFKLVDSGFVKILEDGETYMLLADVSLEDVKLAEVVRSGPITEDLLAERKVDAEIVTAPTPLLT